MFKKLIVKDGMMLELLIERVSPTECRTVKVLRQRPATDWEDHWYRDGYGRMLDFDRKDGGYESIRVKPL